MHFDGISQNLNGIIISTVRVGEEGMTTYSFPIAEYFGG
jgi:hypothetical protein